MYAMEYMEYKWLFIIFGEYYYVMVLIFFVWS